jgi:pimeloyl-ACP methyl ester carboxylesterase
MKDAQALYRDVPSTQRERLFTFRAAHSYQEVTVNGVAWRYIACGRGEEALLFLPGAFLEADMWFNQILAFEEDYRIIAPDAYALQGVFDMDVICDALLQSMDTERTEQATVIGISAGGGVAQMLLQRHPKRVHRVVLSHCGALEKNEETERTTRRILWLVRLLPAVVIRRVLRRMTTREMPFPSTAWRSCKRATRGLRRRGLRREGITPFSSSRRHTPLP